MVMSCHHISDFKLDPDLQQGLSYVNKERKIKLCVFKRLGKKMNILSEQQRTMTY